MDLSAYAADLAAFNDKTALLFSKVKVPSGYVGDTYVWQPAGSVPCSVLPVTDKLTVELYGPRTEHMMLLHAAPDAPIFGGMGVAFTADSTEPDFEAGAKAHCPVDTGNLRDSIHTEAKSNDQVVTGTSVKYGPDVGFGTGPKGDPSVPHTTKKYWRYQDAEGNWHTSHGQPPQPFMRTAFAEGKDKAVDAVKDSIREDVEELMK